MDYEVLIADRTLDYREDLRQFPVVPLVVEPGDFLLDIADRAMSEHGTSWEHPYRSFVTHPDEDGRRLHAGPLIAYVGDGGVFHWARTLDGVRVSDVVRTRERGLFDGDPAALLVEQQTGGDGVLPGSWQELVEWLIALGAVREGVRTVRDGATALGHLIERSRRAWAARGAQPWSLFPVVITHETWDYRELAQLLDVSYDTAVTLLERLGFLQDSQVPTTFRLSADEDLASLRSLIERDFLHVDSRESQRWLWQVQGKPPDWQPP